MSQPYDNVRAAQIRTDLNNANADQPVTLSTLITSISIALWTSESIVDRLDSLLSGLVPASDDGQPKASQIGLMADTQAILDRVQKLSQNMARIENMVSPNPGAVG